MRTQAFSESNGARPIEQGYNRLAIVLTDGRAQDNVYNPANAAQEAGIKVYAVGVTSLNHIPYAYNSVRLSWLLQTYSKFNLCDQPSGTCLNALMIQCVFDFTSSDGDVMVATSIGRAEIIGVADGSSRMSARFAPVGYARTAKSTELGNRMYYN